MGVGILRASAANLGLITPRALALQALMDDPAISVPLSHQLDLADETEPSMVLLSLLALSHQAPHILCSRTYPSPVGS